MKYYPQIIKYENNALFFNDGTTMQYDDGKRKNKIELLNNPDVEDMFYYTYSTSENVKNDAGRIRNEAFLKKIYGTSKQEVLRNLTSITWCKNLSAQSIYVSKINAFDKVVTQLSEELDKHPAYKKYLTKIGGTFNWRFIAGTQRLSNHSFGITIDINTEYSNYWQWDCKCTDENKVPTYKNKIPLDLVKIFEKYGFIWGGRWEHYDTMHFEYRPELVFQE
jgi:hypothetical protein